MGKLEDFRLDFCSSNDLHVRPNPVGIPGTMPRKSDNYSVIICKVKIRKSLRIRYAVTFDNKVLKHVQSEHHHRNHTRRQLI